jgi:tetratricopeptide (TPR) repeat protein
MDPTTLVAAVLVAIGLIGTDAVIYSGSVETTVSNPPAIKGILIDRGTLEVAFDDQLNSVAKVESVVNPPEIRPSDRQGIGMALAEAAGVQEVAFALQNTLGVEHDELVFSLYAEDGNLRAVVSGTSHLTTTFRTVIIPKKDEQLLAFVQRCALWGASQIAPYTTTLYLLEQHSADKDFTDVIALAEHTKALLPPTPRSFDRSRMDNLLGLVALFKNDRQTARTAFDAAMRSDPAGPVPILNAAFTDLQFDDNKLAAERMEQLIRVNPPSNPILLSTAYFTWGAALMGLKDLPAADRVLAEATRINPKSSTAAQLWSEEKALAGDKVAAAHLAQEALARSASLENYAEVAALYFHLSWGDNEPVMRSQFSNPKVVSFN